MGVFCILHARERHVLLIGCLVEQASSEVARSLWVDGPKSFAVGAVPHKSSRAQH